MLYNLTAPLKHLRVHKTMSMHQQTNRLTNATRQALHRPFMILCIRKEHPACLPTSRILDVERSHRMDTGHRPLPQRTGSTSPDLTSWMGSPAQTAMRGLAVPQSLVTSTVTKLVRTPARRPDTSLPDRQTSSLIAAGKLQESCGE